MEKTRSNNRRAKASTRRKRGGIFGYDVRGKMAAMAGKDENAFKPADMGMMAKANEMGAKAQVMGQQGMDAASAGVADARRRMGSMAAPTAARGGRRRRRSTKKGKKSKKSKKSRKTRRRRH